MEGYRRAAENARKGVAILCIQGKLTREGHAMSMTANKVLINNSSRKLISVSPITSGRLLLSSIALIFIIARIAEPKVFERFDIVSVALLSLFVLPWVSQYFSKISIPGVIEAEIRQLRDDVSETKENVENTRELAFKIENKTDELFMESRGKLLAKSGSIEGLTALANKYVDVRKSMTSGSERTTQMTVIFQKMVKEAEVLDVENEVIENWLTLSDPGKNLAAIAFFMLFLKERISLYY